MKNNTNKNQTKSTTNQEQLVDIDTNLEAITSQYKKDSLQRKVALLCSLMVNVFFLVTVYTILCYDGTGQFLGKMLGLNL